MFPSGVNDPAGTLVTPAPPITSPAYPAPTFTTPAPTYTPPPIPTLPSFDPYAAPAAQPPPLFPQSAAAQPGVMRSDGIFIPSVRFLEQIRFEGEWIARNGLGGLGITSTDLNASFTLPIFARQPPFYVTPGFGVHFWDGPDTGFYSWFPPQSRPDLPPRTFDAYLDIAWRPVITPWLSGDLGFRVGVYSDFNYVNNDSIRLPSRGLGIVTLNPRWQVAAGAVYLDRFGVKILPAGGAIWTPRPDVRWEILFPRPKLAQRVYTLRSTDLWGYVAGEYGGGAWTIERVNGAHDSFDYNDFRVLLGMETRGASRMRGWFEVGFVWNRSLQYYRTQTPGIGPYDTVMLRGGLIY